MEIGVLAVLNVMEVLRLALEPALTLLQHTVEMNVREKLTKHKLVTRILVHCLRNVLHGRFMSFLR